MSRPADKAPKGAFTDLRESPLPRRPMRSNGRVRYELLLDAAERLLQQTDGHPLTIQRIAREAGVPTASVYHFLPHPASVAVALSQRYFDGLEAAICAPVPDQSALPWPALVRMFNRRGLAYYRAHPYAQTLVLGSDHSWAIRKADLTNNRRIAQSIAAALAHEFTDVPAELLHDAVVVGMSIGDTLFTLSIAETGSISDALADEAWFAACAYIAARFGREAPPRS